MRGTCAYTMTTVATLTTAGISPRFDGLEDLDLYYVQANTEVPEPTSVSLVGLGLLSVFLKLRKWSV
jgi:PEP-CTERM motif